MKTIRPNMTLLEQELTAKIEVLKQENNALRRRLRTQNRRLNGMPYGAAYDCVQEIIDKFPNVIKYVYPNGDGAPTLMMIIHRYMQVFREEQKDATSK